MSRQFKISLCLVLLCSSLTVRSDEKAVAEYKNIIHKLQSIYEDDFAAENIKLSFEDRLEDDGVNAYSRIFKNKLHVTILGGVAKHPDVTPEALALIACHVLGGYMAGAPLRPGFENKDHPVSTRTQADYWASSKCMKRYLEGENNSDIVDKLTFNPHIRQLCHLVYRLPERTAICIRTSLAGFALTKFFRAYKEEPVEISLFTPDISVAEKTSIKYPSTQCRLDNYFQGALCDIDPLGEVSKKDPNVGFCSRSKGQVVGVRPLCWFNPPSP